ncbi:MAG: LptF/LptG family permease [Bacteriovoracaceae bacterium]|nr:LptF/LptG family permease [Bacteriovoracaceae bacterium]
MGIIRKHIIKEWLNFFLASVVLLLILLTIANLIGGFLRSNVSAGDVIINHFIELPGFASQIFPVACLVASLFSINKLKNRNELTAIFAAGFSRRDFIITIVFIASFAALTQFVLSAYVHPFTKKNRHFLIDDGEKKFSNLKSKGLMSSTIKSGKLWYKTSEFYLAFSSFNKKINQINDITMYRYDNDYNFSEKIIAKTATFLKDGIWKFDNGVSYHGINQRNYPTITNFETINIPLGMDIEQFKKAESDITTLNIHQLDDYIGHLEKSGINTNEYKVMYWEKFSTSFVCIIFALMASVGIFKPNRRNSSFGKTVIFVFVFTLAYWFIYSYVTELGRSSKLPPLAACFAVPVFFLAYITQIIFKNRKLS